MESPKIIIALIDEWILIIHWYFLLLLFVLGDILEILLLVEDNLISFDELLIERDDIPMFNKMTIMTTTTRSQ